tara:strand:+ start:114 stop:491 length:378 start_codon:yes stop_codon:yes gene_type:complete
MSVHTPVYMNNQLFGCTDDVGDCLYAGCCGPCHVGSIAQRTGSGDCFGTCCINYIAYMFCCGIGGIVHGGSVFKSALYRVGVRPRSIRSRASAATRACSARSAERSTIDKRRRRRTRRLAPRNRK